MIKCNIGEAYVMGTEAAYAGEERVDVPNFETEAHTQAWLKGYDNEVARLENPDHERDFDDLEADQGEYYRDDFRDGVEADADVLASAGFGTDEDYGFFGGDEW